VNERIGRVVPAVSIWSLGENLGEGEKEAAPVTQPLLAGAAYLNNAPAVTALRINGSG